jgi:hypothetical protein
LLLPCVLLLPRDGLPAGLLVLWDLQHHTMLAADNHRHMSVMAYSMQHQHAELFKHPSINTRHRLKAHHSCCGR